MKRLFVAATAIVMSLAAMAEGYQVNSLSARQNGMGHTGTALKLGAESMFFNPAGLGFMDATVDATASITGIFSECTATVDGKDYVTDSKASTPMNVMFGFSVYDNLKFGVAFYTPYGSNINWGETWPGSMLNQSVKLTVMTVQPTVAWKPLPNLAIGAGMTINWGSVNLNKALITGQQMDQVLALAGAQPMFGNANVASVNLTGNATPRLGVNLGVMWDINDKWTVGFDYRSQVMMKVKAGTASLTTAPQFPALVQNPVFGKLAALSYIDKASFSAAMPAVAVYRLGVAYKPIAPLTIALDAQLSGWNQYKELDIEFADEIAANFNQHIEKNYHNSWLFGLGAQYELTPRFDLRAGLIVDTTPCNKDFYNPETPGMTKIEPSVGLTFRPVKGLAVNASFLYVKGLGADNRQCAYENSVTGMKETFKADYTLHAVCPAVGLSYTF